MTVSGLGTPRTPRSPITPVHRAPRAEKPAPGAGTPAPGAGKPAQRTEFDHLTGADRELIFQATGQRVGPGFDPARDAPTAFAAALAHERATGHLAPGQPVTAVYLKDLDRRYHRRGGPNPVEAHLDKALGYLSQAAPRRFDVSA